MKKLVIAALVSAQLTTAQPALAAALEVGGSPQVGVFGGVQLRLPLGEARAEAPRASLGIAPMARSQQLDGARQTVIGEGLQLSLTPNRPVEVSFAGTRLDRFRLTPDGQTPGGPRAGVSTLGWVAIGVGTVVVLTGGFYYWLLEESKCGPGEC